MPSGIACWVSISLAPVGGGPAYCLRNQIYLTGAGTSQEGYTGLPFKFNSSDGDSGAIYIMHNTVDAQRAGNDGFRIMSPGTWTRLFARNNVFAGTLHAPSFVAPAAADFTPAPGSPLIDRGLYIPGINDGFRGQAPDLGAIEAP
jgi:hypothetical protein